MKTIFITSFHPMISRNILSTNVLRLLQTENDLRIILIVPSYKKEYFQQKFGSANVIVEGAELYQASKYFLGLFFKRMGVYFFNTRTATVRKKYQYYHDKKIMKFAFSIFMGYVGHFFFFRRFMRWLDLRLSPKNFFAELFKAYVPDLIFSTDIQNENDVSVMHDARVRGYQS